MSEMISFGAGVNSVAMTIMLVNEGWRGPIVFADTGGEHPETYCYMTMFERDWLKPRGLEITRITPATYPHLYSERKHIETISLEAYCLTIGVIPIMAARWCSLEYKRKPMERWANGRIQYVGISADEPRRVRDMSYPLVDQGITRGECVRMIQRQGLEIPPKSSCFFCPMQRVGQWKDLYFHHPDLYDRAAQMERRASEARGAPYTLRPDNISLDEMRHRRWQGQTEMDLSEWLPCACVL